MLVALQFCPQDQDVTIERCQTFYQKLKRIHRAYGVAQVCAIRAHQSRTLHYRETQEFYRGLQIKILHAFGSKSELAGFMKKNIV